MVDLGKYSVKELSETGVDFYLTDIVTGMELEEPKFVLYGMDSNVVTVARRKFSDLTSNKNIKDWKKEEYYLDFIIASVKSWQSFKFNGEEVADQDAKALRKFLVDAPQFKEQIGEFVTERSNFLAD